MPRLISREEAVKSIGHSIPSGECLVCWIQINQSKNLLYKGNWSSVILSAYPRTWGQTMIVLHEHKTTFGELSIEEWSEMSFLLKKSTVGLENVLKPLRCYVASLGSVENLTNTCPHLHFNILPIYSQVDKPSDIFTWKNGLYQATDAEWEELRCLLMKEWNRN